MIISGRKYDQLYLKRIVGPPGEKVAVNDGFVAIDGQPLIEPYVSLRSAWNVPELIPGKDEYLVIGDNRAIDAAWHLFGRVERIHILGKVVW
jgi:signal peptidase I